jgi:hypothetical protein
MATGVTARDASMSRHHVVVTLRQSALALSGLLLCVSHLAVSRQWHNYKRAVFTHPSLSLTTSSLSASLSFPWCTRSPSCTAAKQTVSTGLSRLALTLAFVDLTLRRTATSGSLRRIGCPVLILALHHRDLPNLCFLGLQCSSDILATALTPRRTATNGSLRRIGCPFLILALHHRDLPNLCFLGLQCSSDRLATALTPRRTATNGSLRRIGCPFLVLAFYHRDIQNLFLGLPCGSDILATALTPRRTATSSSLRRIGCPFLILA